MGSSVNTNIAALNSYRNLSVTQGSLNKSLEKLSSGFRINRAADDAAGLAISYGLRAQIGGLKVAVRNAQDGISVVQTAEGALTETHSILQRMRDLAVQASNDGALKDVDKQKADKEYQELVKELNDIAGKTTFNGTSLLNGGFSAKAFQVGSNAGETLSVTIADMSASALSGGGAALSATSISAASAAASALSAVDGAIGTVSDERAKLGAIQNRLEHKINNLNTTIENLTASESRIRDTDMAQEMTNFSRTQILSQAGTAMLAQANSSTQGILKLLG